MPAKNDTIHLLEATILESSSDQVHGLEPI